MNKLSKSVILGLSLLGITALTAQAHPHDTPVVAKNQNIQAPVPIKVVHPGVDADQVGKVVNVRFALDETGRPRQIEAVDPTPEDAVLAERIIRALRSWEFEPARNLEGQAISVIVEMPIVVKHMARG